MYQSDYKMIILKENTITVEDYLKLRAQVGWKKLKRKQAETALKNSIHIIGAYDGDDLVGMGRIVGDGAVVCYIQDLIVIPSSQHMGVGSTVLNALIQYVDYLREEDSQMMLCLMCAKGREKFYEKHGFFTRPTEHLGPGMMQYL